MITPIIMEVDIVEVERKLGLLTEQGQKRVHMDIGDGMFSEFYSIAPMDLLETNISKFETDIHLLVDDPTEYVEESVSIKPVRIIGQIERMGSQNVFLETVAGYGISGGLALKIETSFEEIEREVLGKCKTILLLAIPAGTTGSPFDPRVLDKIRKLRKIYQGSILIDGGINKETYKMITDAGASEAGADSAWWRGEWENSDTVTQ